jgi:hypothetical protein
MADNHEFAVSDFGMDSSSPLQSQFDTLFAEFSRSRPRVSPPGSPGLLSRHDSPRKPETPKLDLRALEYVSEYDSHLMCPICHVPFINPVVLECDHTFCESCLKEHLESGQSELHSQCPSCRTFLLSSERKASRLIVNMCNEIKVKCPHEDCDEVVPRGYIERHATKECPHERLQCPDLECGKVVKRKNFVPDQCIHSSHIECDCGAVIELGKGEWLRHKDEDCPNTGVKCPKCDQRISARDYLSGINGHICTITNLCPGREYGCTDETTPDSFASHKITCPMAKLAPYLNKQSQLLTSLQSQLSLLKIRNEVLETGLENITTIVNNYHDHPDHESEVEEIERDHIPTHRDLLMPAHLRALTPSPTPNMEPATNTILQTQQHLLALHESLRGTVGNLENDITVMSNNLADLDARSSMQIMNETLRLKEELAHTNAAVFSTRSQVQWLLQRERIGQQQQSMGIRGRTPAVQSQLPTQPQALNQGSSSASGSISEGSTSDTSPTMGAALPVQGQNHDRQPSPGFVASSPNFRPQIRRLSGSQERVKL